MGDLFRICNFLNNVAILKITMYVLCILVYLVKSSSFSVSAFKYVMQLYLLFTQTRHVGKDLWRKNKALMSFH